MNNWITLNTSDIIAIISIVITIYFSVRYVRKSKFFILLDNQTKLYDVVKGIENLEIKFKGEEITQPLTYIKGAIIYRGKNDISGDDIDIPIIIKSKNHLVVWKDFKILKSSEDFNPSLTIDEGKVLINNKLIKSNDYLSFNAIIEGENNDVVVSHRVSNVKSRATRLNTNNAKGYLAIGLTAFIGFLILFLTSLGFFNKDYLQNYKKQFYYNDIAFNLDSLEKVEYYNDSLKHLISVENQKIAQIVKSSKIALDYDSIVKILQANTNKYDSIVNETPTPFSYSLDADSICEYNIANKSIKESYKYKINENISVTFSKKNIIIDPFIDIIQNGKINFWRICFSILMISTIVFFSISSFKHLYKYYQIKIIMKILHN